MVEAGYYTRENVGSRAVRRVNIFRMVAARYCTCENIETTPINTFLPMVEARSYTRENIRNRTYAAYKYFGVWYFSPLTPPLATNLPCFTTKKISRRSKKKLSQFVLKRSKIRCFVDFLAPRRGKCWGILVIL